MSNIAIDLRVRLSGWCWTWRQFRTFWPHCKN